MELASEDKKIIDLLSKLKDLNGTYPSDILAARRQVYIKQISSAGLGIGVGAEIKNATKIGSGTGTVATVASKILETVLIAAIVIEAGAIAYIYRDKIADIIRTYTGSSITQEPASSSNDASSPSSGLVEKFPSATDTMLSVTVTTPSGTITVTSGTPLPDSVGDNNDNNSGVGVNATPKPNENNGNHYGNTPKPERTKDNNKDEDKDKDKEDKDKDKKNKP